MSAAIDKGSRVRLKLEYRDRFTDHRITEVAEIGKDDRWAMLKHKLGGQWYWPISDLETEADNMARVGNEADSRAEVDFDPALPLALSRSSYQQHEKCVYIYSPAVDGVNKLRVATVQIANVVGLNGQQVEFLTNKIADSIVDAFA